MKRWALQALGPALLALVAILVARPPLTAAPAGRVYSVAQLQAYLAADPRHWIGRTVLIRATLSGGAIFSPCSTGRKCPPFIPITTLIPPYNDNEATPMILDPGSDGPLADLLRRLPLLAALLPAPQRLHWAGPAVYRVRLERQPSRYAPYDMCWGTPCAAAVLLHAVPSDFGR